MNQITPITYKIELITLVLLGTVFIWDIGIYPAWFDHIVAQSIWPEVNQILDGRPHPLQGITRWQWQDMYQHNAGLSPLYGFLISSGLKSGGLSLLSIRLPQALLALPVFCFAYIVFRNRIGQPLSLVFAVLLGTSPWFLIMMRSGGIIGFNGTLLTLALSLICLMFPANFQIATRSDEQINSNKTPWLAVAAGFSVSLLPYGHSSIRLLAVVLFVGVPLCYRIIGSKATIAFFAGTIPVLLLQLTNLSHAIDTFFLVRGEGLLHVAAGHGDFNDSLKFIIEKLTSNLEILLKILFGLNNPENLVINNIANSYWSSEVVLYPKFLVPFFSLGFIFSTIDAIKNKSTFHIFLLLGLLITIFPSLLSGLGTPNQARLFISIAPIYLVISYSMCTLYQMGRKKWPVSSINLLALLTLICAFFQTYNFFSFEKGTIDDKHTYAQMIEIYRQIRQECPDSIIALHEFPEFNQYSYVTIRWRGESKLEDELNNHITWLLDFDNAKTIDQVFQQHEQIVLISHKASSELAQQLLINSKPSFKDTTFEQIQIYSKNCG